MCRGKGRGRLGVLRAKRRQGEAFTGSTGGTGLNLLFYFFKFQIISIHRCKATTISSRTERENKEEKDNKKKLNLKEKVKQSANES